MKLSLFSRVGAVPLAAGLVFGGCGGSGEGSADASLSLQERISSGRESDFGKQQELVRQCMVAQGFEYTPQDNRGRTDGGPRNLDERSEEYVAEYGFGISTLFGSEIRVSSSDEDPNQQYRNSLSDAQKSAYDRALYGQDLGGGGFSSSGGPVIGISVVEGPPAGGGPDSSGGEPQLRTPGGCLGEALKATGGDEPFDTGLFDELQDLEERIKADPKIVEGMKRWSACMSDAGYDYRDIDEARSEIREEFAEVTGLDVSGGGGGFVIRGNSAGDSGAEPGEPGRVFDPLANADKEELAELQAKEKRVAVASLECFDEHLAKTEQQVRAQFEEEFLEEHPDLVDD